MAKKELNEEEIMDKIRQFLEEKQNLSHESCYFITKKLNESYWEDLKGESEDEMDDDLDEELDDDLDEEPEEELDEELQEKEEIKPKKKEILKKPRISISKKKKQEEIDAGQF